MKDGHIRPLPIANNAAAAYSNIISLETNNTKFIPKIMLPIIIYFSSENFVSALRKTGPCTATIIPLNTAKNIPICVTDQFKPTTA